MRTLILKFALIVCAWMVASADAPPSYAQGCVCQKQGSPAFGGLETYLRQGERQITVSFRGYESTEHFRGTEAFPSLDPNGPINKQLTFVGDLTYGLTDKWGISLSIPWYKNGFAVRRAGPDSSTPYFQDTPVSGVGDVSLRARYWLFSTENPRRNVSLTGGLKGPSGSAGSTGTVGGRTVPADVSIQTGDKAWGITTAVQAFQDWDRVSVYGTLSYLFNPRNTTGVPTFFGSLNNPNNTTMNSSADQYSSQVGASVVISRKLPVPSIAYRIEGVPVHDVFGKSDGFRRPGMISFFEPGINMQIHGNLVSFSVAIRDYVNIKDSPTSTRREDATVPQYMFFAAYSRRF